jgi:hypothetical protein
VKTIYFIPLLILFICGPGTSSVTGQVNKHNTTCDSLTGHFYEYDSCDVMEIAKLILENEMYKENESLYTQRDSLFTIRIIILEGKISTLQTIIGFKEQQLSKLEKTQVQITDKRWKWWQYIMAAVGAVTFGFTAGVIYESVNH